MDIMRPLYVRRPVWLKRIIRLMVFISVFIATLGTLAKKDICPGSSMELEHAASTRTVGGSSPSRDTFNRQTQQLILELTFNQLNQKLPRYAPVG